jgi:glycosyltransferase involved in cell wall biosynthesis
VLILFVASIYRPNIGGIEKFIEEMGTHLQKKGHEVIVLTKKYPIELAEKETIKNIRVIRVESPETEEEFLKCAHRIAEIGNNLNADIIHLVGIRRPLAFFLPFLRNKMQAKWIVTFAGGDVVNINYKEEWNIWQSSKFYLIPALSQADAYTAFSKDLVRLAHECIPSIASKEIKVIMAGIDMSLVKNSEPFHTTYPYFMTAARLFDFKGINIAIDAFHLLIQEKDIPGHMRLKIIGDGPEKEHLQKMVFYYQIQDRIDFLGTKDLSYIYSTLKNAQGLLSPSYDEGGGTINIEASSCGCVPIGSNTGGIPEYIQDGKTGLLFQKGDAGNLVQKMRLLLKDKTYQDKLRQQGLEWTKQFSWNNIAGEYEELYRKITSAPSQKTQSWSELSAETQKIIEGQGLMNTVPLTLQIWIFYRTATTTGSIKGAQKTRTSSVVFPSVIKIKKMKIALRLRPAI